jgi:hypothetical protein
MTANGEEFFDLLGLGVPFYLAAATYGVFSWADSNASDEATQVISSWLHGRSKHKPDLGNLIISAFDRIYTLTVRAFRRSAAISSVIWVLVYLIPWLIGLPQHWDYVMLVTPPEVRFVPTMLLLFTMILFTIILVDYLSLLFVRRFLAWARIYPITASLTSSIELESLYWSLVSSQFAVFGDAMPPLLPTFFVVMRPAFIIYLWLPLFALSSLVVRLVYLLFRAVEWAQWFLKQGDAHPLKAIGLVATIIVFGSAMLVKEAWTVL